MSESKAEFIDGYEKYADLWDKFFDNIDKLTDKERKIFCEFMEKAGTPMLYMETDCEPEFNINP